MDRIVPRLQVFEIDDQAWFPPFLRTRVQAILTHLWTTRLPPIQPASPATQTAQILLRIFGSSFPSHTVLDFCAGAGGPTPAIERAVNQALTAAASQLDPDSNSASADQTGRDPNGNGNSPSTVLTARKPTGITTTTTPVSFILTDLSPNPHAWEPLCASQPHLHYIPHPIDATAAPSSASLLSSLSLPTNKKILRTFHLSFHHFPDDLAVEILRDTFRTADAIAIVELIERSLSSLVVDLVMLVPMAVLTPAWSWVGTREAKAARGNGVRWGIDWVLLFFTYVLPIVPFVVVWDGWMSSLRARTAYEIMELVKRANEGGNGLGEDWVWEAGRECHTWPLGYTTYVVGRKRE